MAKWFVDEVLESYVLVLKVNKPRCYVENGYKFINVFRSWKWTAERPITNDEMTGIELVWNHVKTVLCSDNIKSYELLRKCMTLIVAGRKVKIINLFRGSEGCGKGIFTNFIFNKVIGSDLCYMAPNSNCLTDKFNAELDGIVLLDLEELHCKSKEDWITLGEQLKIVATEPMISIHIKNKNPYNVDNIISVIGNSNTSDPIPMTKHDRRVHAVDVSDCKIENTNENRLYFENIGKYVDLDSFGEAFYWDCIHRAKDIWNMNELAELREIETGSKQEMILSNLHPFYIYMKNNYVLKSRPLKLFLCDLVDEVNFDDNIKRKLKNHEVSKLLKEIQIHNKVSTGNRARYDYTWEELYACFDKQKLIHPLDEICVMDESETHQKIKPTLIKGLCKPVIPTPVILAPVIEPLVALVEPINDDDNNNKKKNGKNRKNLFKSEPILKLCEDEKIIKKMSNKPIPAVQKRVLESNFENDLIDAFNKL